MIAFDVPVNAPDGAVVDVAVSLRDMPTPIRAELTVQAGEAQGTVEVPAGAERSVTITSRRGSGPRCSRETSTNVYPGIAVAIALPLLCEEDVASGAEVLEDEPPPPAPVAEAVSPEGSFM
jgi:hypothetical protein